MGSSHGRNIWWDREASKRTERHWLQNVMRGQCLALSKISGRCYGADSTFACSFQAMKSQTDRTVSSMGLVLENKLEEFKGYLMLSEETGPLPYRVTAPGQIVSISVVIVVGVVVMVVGAATADSNRGHKTLSRSES